MREVDDPHHAENQREAATDQKQQRAIRNSVEGLGQPELRIHSLPNPSAIAKARRAYLTTPPAGRKRRAPMNHTACSAPAAAIAGSGLGYLWLRPLFSAAGCFWRFGRAT